MLGLTLLVGVLRLNPLAWTELLRSTSSLFHQLITIFIGDNACAVWLCVRVVSTIGPCLDACLVLIDLLFFRR